ncbi:uncharacterized protein LOC111044652 [Nilaparvata lugens]|uniref:uncharacterized protein LOC111044652 n=1 Tax=Nilaparvata lugens TaxID=108931 RepID=UPI00193D6FC6|nr:uncharacterized protein LOC111044652 [Nilaparvata lugens]
MFVVSVSRLLFCVSSVSILLETCNLVTEGSFRTNMGNNATFSDVMLMVQATYKDGRRFDGNNVYVFVNTEQNCWTLSNRGVWKRSLKCIEQDVPGHRDIELYNKRLYTDSIIPYRGYRYNGYH